MNEYKVKLPIFEGPLDLLLHLIRQNEMEISEISISQITTQYLEYLRVMEALDLEVAGDFLVMATTLLNIKLRALLPATDDEEATEQEAELDNFMSARQLMARLVEYRKFKEAAHELGQRAERQAQVFVRDVALPAIAEAQKDEAIVGDIEALLTAFSRVLRYVEKRREHEVKAEEHTVEQKVGYLRSQLLVEPRLQLSTMFESCTSKIEMIVLVIAILELCRMKELRVRQNDQFGEVFVFRTDSAPEAEYETMEGGKGRAKKLAAAAALERIEQEIFANRTGVIDDGELPPDSEDQLIEQVLAQDAGLSHHAEETPPPVAECAPGIEDAPLAQVVELHPADSTPSETQ